MKNKHIITLMLLAIALTSTPYVIAAGCFSRGHVLIRNRSGASLTIETSKRVMIGKGHNKRIYGNILTLNAEGYATVRYSAPACQNQMGYNALQVTYRKNGTINKEWL